MTEPYRPLHADQTASAAIHGEADDALEMFVVDELRRQPSLHPSAIRREVAWAAGRWAERALAELDGGGADDAWDGAGEELELARGTPTNGTPAVDCGCRNGAGCAR